MRPPASLLRWRGPRPSAALDQRGERRHGFLVAALVGFAPRLLSPAPLGQLLTRPALLRLLRCLRLPAVRGALVGRFVHRPYALADEIAGRDADPRRNEGDRHRRQRGDCGPVPAGRFHANRSGSVRRWNLTAFRGSYRPGPAAFPSPPRVLQRHGRAFFGDHDGGAVGVAGGDRGHDRGVDHAEVLQPVDLQPVGDDGPAVAAHFAGADRVVGGGAEVGGGAGQLLVGPEGGAGHEFLRRIGRQRSRGGDAPGQPHRLHRHLPVAGRGEVVGPDRGRLLRVRGFERDPPPALRPEVAGRGGEGREGMQRLAEPV